MKECKKKCRRVFKVGGWKSGTFSVLIMVIIWFLLEREINNTINRIKLKSRKKRGEIKIESSRYKLGD